MKFGHGFKEALQRYPLEWVDSAVPYRQLKKVLGRVRRELRSRGYDPDTLQTLLKTQNAQYHLGEIEAANDCPLRPRLTIRVRVEGGMLVNAMVAPQTWYRLREFSMDSGQVTGAMASDESDGSPRALLKGQVCEEITEVIADDNTSDDHPPSTDDIIFADEDWIEVPLSADNEFFSLLKADFNKLESLQASEQDSMHAEIIKLGTEVKELSKPSGHLRLRRFRTDLYPWRELFALYMDAEIFFSTLESDGHAARDSNLALKRLVWFQEQVSRVGLPRRFRQQESVEAYGMFLELNRRLLLNLQFRELNRMAVTKIVKKFDKQTCLGVRAAFTSWLDSDQFMVESVAKNVCAELSQAIVCRVPRLVDFLCPICQELNWLPVKLSCGHTFCIQCMVRMQSMKKEKCPMCRAPTVVIADSLNVDDKLVRYMERWFPKEVKIKQRENERERGKELWGEHYEPGGCAVM